jgi:hypothetical protein
MRSKAKSVAPVTIKSKFEGSGYATVEAFVDARLRFRDAARQQRVCQNPDCRNPRGSWDPHHVVYEQELRRLHVPIYDPHNALRLCKHCHMNHHRARPVPQTALKTCNLKYAREVLGEHYVDYINRRYIPECPI